MNLDIMKELLAIAGRLDEKGLTKEADVIDRIVKSAAPGDVTLGDRPSLGGGGEVATLDGPIIPEGSSIEGARERYLARRDAAEGTIKPRGDKYTYNYDEENDLFIVATDPNPGHPMVGHKMRRGSKGYDVLFPELPPDIQKRLNEEKQRRADSIEGLYPSRDMMLTSRRVQVEELLNNIGPGLMVHLKKSNNGAIEPEMQDFIIEQLRREVERQMQTGTSNRVDRSALAQIVRGFDLNNVSKARIIGYFDPVTEGSYVNQKLDSIAPLPDPLTDEALPNARPESTP